MEDFLDTILIIYGKFIGFLFSFELTPGISLGYLFVAVSIIGIVFFYFIGRLK